MIDFADVLAIASALNREAVRYKVIGGVAANLHGIPRATEDADFLIDPSPANVGGVKRALRSVWDDPHVDDIRDDDMLSEFPLLTYRAPNVPFCVNFCAALPYDDFEAATVDVRGVPVSVVTPEALYEMKRATLRYKDSIDAIHLRERFDFAE